MSKYEENRPEMENLEYKQLRFSAFVRDKFVCQLCRMKSKNLQCHHIRRWHDAPELRYQLSNVITLCNSCHHDKVTGHEEEYEEQFKRILEQQKISKTGVKKKSVNQYKPRKYRPRNPYQRY